MCIRDRFYTEVLFVEKNVRFIAINNGIDSANQQDSDFTPFLNIMNEFYARDTSKKIKAVLKAKGESGRYLSTIPPYGYIKNPEDKRQWLVAVSYTHLDVYKRQTLI